jgi:hypothetical protein
MRLSRTETYVLPLVLAATVVLAFVIYRLVGFLGVSVLGLLIGFIAVRMNLEKDGAIGSAFSSNLYVRQMTAHQSMSRSERAAHHAEKGALARALTFAKIIGATLITFGFGAAYYLG